jgi:2'-5' RNA ligase
MYYCLSFYPMLSQKLSALIGEIRSAYDPTSRYYKPHVTLIFPTHDRVGEQPLIDHIQNVLGNWSQFEIRLGGLHKTPSHWLLLGLQDGEEDAKRMYRELHTGILDDGRDLSRYRPHIGLGLFVKTGVAHHWFNPRESDFDREKYQEALQLTEDLPLAEDLLVDKLLLGALSDSVIDWVRDVAPPSRKMRKK